jgi:hypothetical protein
MRSLLTSALALLLLLTLALAGLGRASVKVAPLTVSPEQETQLPHAF